MNREIELLVSSRIFFIREQKVILDFHIAELYGVETRTLKQQVRRNIQRFPDDFLIQLTIREWQELITNCDKVQTSKFSPAVPFGFTEQGVAMLSSILRSPKAIEVNIAIMRTFVKLRKMMETNEQLRTKVEDLERKYDGQFQIVFKAIKSLIEPEKAPRRAIGYKIDKDPRPMTQDPYQT